MGAVGRVIHLQTIRWPRIILGLEYNANFYIV